MAKVGRPREIKEPQEFIDGFEAYYKKETSSPLFFKYEAIKSGDRAGELIAIPLTPVISKYGFAEHMGFSEWDVIEGYKKINSEFVQVITRIANRILKYQVEGAMAGGLNPNIVARVNALSENINSNNTNHESILDKLQPPKDEPSQKAE